MDKGTKMPSMNGSESKSKSTAPSRPLKPRIWELDFFRGVALVFMVIFHIIFDLKEIYGVPVAYASGLVFYVGKAAIILFTLIAGISCSFSSGNFRRGVKIFALGLLITAATYIYDPALNIKFGVLHFLGTCIILYPLFKNVGKYWLIAAGTAAIIAGVILSGIKVPFDYLFIFGLTSNKFASADYYPLLPWGGIFLYGIALSRFLYKEKRSLFNFDVSRSFFLNYIGRHTLIIYMVHQPIILLVLEMLKRAGLKGLSQ